MEKEKINDKERGDSEKQNVKVKLELNGNFLSTLLVA